MSKQRLIWSAVVVAVIALAVACVKKTVSKRESEWHGLTEREARAKLDEKLPGKIPADKREQIADKVVSKMRDRGVLSEDSTVPDDISGLTERAST